MVSRARVTSKGQVTLPVELRRRLDIRSGDDLLFDEVPDGATLRVVRKRGLGEFLGALPSDRPFRGHAAERRAAARRLAERDR